MPVTKESNHTLPVFLSICEIIKAWWTSSKKKLKMLFAPSCQKKSVLTKLTGRKSRGYADVSGQIGLKLVSKLLIWWH